MFSVYPFMQSHLVPSANKKEWTIICLTAAITQTNPVTSQKTEKILEIYPEGNSKLAKQITSTYLVDLISIYLAILHEIDPSITPSIDKLKAVLKKKNNLQAKIEKEIG